ncbi:MAG: ThuA domain-containing protein [Pirellulales bacterium]|nr:ThuA domain-containing protein [Pirellulales bacterium]
MTRLHMTGIFAIVLCGIASLPTAAQDPATALRSDSEGSSLRQDDAFLVLDGTQGPAADLRSEPKHIVLISGDEEYRSEETLPALAQILAQRHGFKCTVCFAIDSATGEINPNVNNNIPGLQSLESADLMVIFTRYRDLPDEQMRYIVDYVEAGKPIVAIRTSTHAFKLDSSETYKRYSVNGRQWQGGFGRHVLGETWVAHHGQHGRQSSRGVFVEGQQSHPILRGIGDGDIWGPTDVYRVRLPLRKTCQPLVLGQVLSGMREDSEPVTGEQNAPMMPIAWTNVYEAPSGKTARIFTSTIGASQDFANKGVRRLLVNACYWGLNLEGEVPEAANVDFFSEFKPTRFRFDGYKRGVKPSDWSLERP